MEDQIISFETAKLAKEKKFNIECDKSQCIINSRLDKNPRQSLRNTYPGYEQGTINVIESYYAPTQSLLQKWLREVHNIHIDCKFIDQILNFQSVVTAMNCNTETFESLCFDKYEEALEEGLFQALNLIGNED